MSKAISGLHEVEGPNLIEERHKRLEDCHSGLGPDDLVCIDKIQTSLFHHSNEPITFFHSLGGLPLDSQAPFSAYFYSLLSRQESSNWFPGSSTYKITKGHLYTWDSFSLKEAIITVGISGGCLYFQKSLKDESTLENITESDWKQIFLSSKLRYYRAGQPLLYGLLSTNYIDTPFYNVWDTLRFTTAEIEYCIHNHLNTDDFQLSLSFALLINTDANYILQILDKYDSKLSKILLFILRNISLKSNLAKSLIPIIDKHIKLYPDDLEVICLYSIILINLNDQNKCNKLFPLIMNSIWSSPLPSLVCSIYCFAIDNYYDCISFLNLSCLLTNSSKIYKEIDSNYQSTIPNNTLPKGLSQYEQSLIIKPLTSIYSYYIKFLFDIINKIGDIKFITITKPFIEKKRIKMKNINYEQLKSKYFFEPNDDNSKKFVDLYDPGIETICCFPNELKSLPISDEFSQLIDVTKEYYEENKLIMENNNNLAQNLITEILIKALKCENKELIKILLERIKNENETSALNKLLLLKACAQNLINDIDAILQIKVNSITEEEKNALGFMEMFAIGIRNLENCEINEVK